MSEDDCGRDRTLFSRSPATHRKTQLLASGVPSPISPTAALNESTYLWPAICGGETEVLEEKVRVSTLLPYAVYVELT